VSVSERELLTIGQRASACNRLVKELEESPARYTLAGKEELRLARARLRQVKRELNQLKQAGQMRLLDAPLKEQGGRK